MSTDHVHFNQSKFRKEYSEWINDNEVRTWRLEKPMREAQELLSVGTLTHSQRVAIGGKMARIGPFYCAQGAVLCFSDPAQGWRLMKRGLLYSYWDERIACRRRDFWEPDPEREDDHWTLASSLTDEAVLGLAIARPEAIWLLDVMERGLTDGSISWWESDFFAAYLVRLCRKLKGQEDIKNIPPDAEDWDHPFGDLIDNWNDEEKLAEAIKAMCDYHLYWNYEETQEHDSEFAAPFMMVNPVEIHALEVVRSELGLSTPHVEHELLQPPFYPLPEFANNITTEELLAEDDLLRRIVELNQPWCDGLEE